MESFLESAGLTRTESKIYLVLLENGSSQAGRISQKSGIHRRSVYDAIERLIEKGLVSYIVENNCKYFEAVHPRHLVDLVKEKEDSLQAVLPQLELKYSISSHRNETLFFRGKSGLKSVFEDQIHGSTEILVLGATSFPERTVNYFFPRFDVRRKKARIHLKMLFFGESRGLKPHYSLCSVRFLPQKKANDSTVYIYGTKVAIVQWGSSPFAILINQKDISESFRSYFSMLWLFSEN